MIDRDERLLAEWLREGPERGPSDGLARLFAKTRSTPQRPAWSFPSHWVGFEWPDRMPIAPLVLLLLLLLAVLASVLLVAGARPRTAPLVGPAGNGALAWDTGTGGRIYLAAPDGSRPQALDGAYAITRSPAFSRDGTKLVFWSRPNQQQGTPLDLFSANADGSNVRKINGDLVLNVNVFSSPSWSPDGRHVVLSSADPGGVMRLYVATVDGSAPPVAITGADAARDGAAWSPDGRWIAFHKLAPGPGGVSSFSIVRPDGTGETDLASHPDPIDGGNDTGPVWAPDSSAIVFGRPADPSKAAETPFAAYAEVATVGGRVRRIFADEGGSIGWPDWSPDGAWIGIVSGSNGNLLIVRPDGSEPTTLAAGLGQNAADCGARWAPDGGSLVWGCAGFVRVFLSDQQHPVRLPLPSTATGFDWQRRPLP